MPVRGPAVAGPGRGDRGRSRPGPASSGAPGAIPWTLRVRRYSSASLRTTSCSTNRRRALWDPGRRRAADTMPAEASAVSRRTVAPKGTSASRRRGRWRVRTARATTIDHAGLALEAGHAGRVLGPDLDPVDEPLDRRQGHAGLAQRRQHVLDVAQEQGVGPDRRARPGARAGSGACREGMRPGAAPPPSCRCPGRPGRPGRPGAASG